jgi:hypothetical protein
MSAPDLAGAGIGAGALAAVSAGIARGADLLGVMEGAGMLDVYVGIALTLFVVERILFVARSHKQGTGNGHKELRAAVAQLTTKVAELQSTLHAAVAVNRTYADELEAIERQVTATHQFIQVETEIRKRLEDGA